MADPMKDFKAVNSEAGSVILVCSYLKHRESSQILSISDSKISGVLSHDFKS